MIRFALTCGQGHAFESWFRDNVSFEAQSRRGLVACPMCGDTRVEKAIMAPHVARRDRSAAEPSNAGETIATGSQADTAVPAREVALLGEEDAALREMIRAIRRKVEEQADHVGPRFAEEALKMHHQEIEHRAIYGSATPEERQTLREEGVEFHPLPTLPDDRN
jgi:hypothetical protein